jgi:hypothetical protein
MSSRVSLYRALRSTTGGHWWEALLQTFFTLVGGIAPLWIGWIIVRSTLGSPEVLDFARHGEFALYTASLLAPSLYLIVRESYDVPFPGAAILALLSLFGILLAVASYTIVAPETSRAIGYTLPKSDFIGTASVKLFLFSAVLSLVITALDNARARPAVKEIDKLQERALENEFDRLK